MSYQYDDQGNFVGYVPPEPLLPQPVKVDARPIMDSKIQIIKWIRTYHDIGLKDSKEAVEAMFDSIKAHERDVTEEFMVRQRQSALMLLRNGHAEQAEEVLAARNLSQLVNAERAQVIPTPNFGGSR